MLRFTRSLGGWRMNGDRVVGAFVCVAWLLQLGAHPSGRYPADMRTSWVEWWCRVKSSSSQINVRPPETRDTERRNYEIDGQQEEEWWSSRVHLTIV